MANQAMMHRTRWFIGSTWALQAYGACVDDRHHLHQLLNAGLEKPIHNSWKFINNSTQFVSSHFLGVAWFVRREI